MRVTMPRILNKRTATVAELAGAIYVGRPSKWGNPFSHLRHSRARYRVKTVQEAVDSYRTWLKETDEGRQIAADARQELRGCDLVCWGCNPCHATVLLEVANRCE
jgi:hypothetical protein